MQSGSSRVIICVVGILLMVLMLPAPTQSEHSNNLALLDPELRSIVRGNAPSSLASVTTTADGAQIDVILRASSDITPNLEALGIGVRSVLDAHDELPFIITADVPFDAIDDLTTLPDLISAEAAQMLFPLIDEAVQDTNIDDVWELQYQEQNLQGSGVIIAIVDSGIDYRHPAFWRSDGSTRILEIWDQLAVEGTPPPGYNYGHLCTREQIEAQTCNHRDTSGHGTHIASIAAGGGIDTRYRGVAPAADLLIVRHGTIGRTIDAWSYIVNRARTLGRPVVINNSFGRNYGPHDGTSVEDQAIASLSAPGVAFVVAAGNLGDEAAHAEGTIQETQAITIPVTMPVTSSLDVSAVDLWYHGDDALSVSVTAPNGQVYGPVLPGEVEDFLAGSIRVTIDAQQRQKTPVSPIFHADNGVLISLQWPEGEYASSDWAFTMRGESIVTDGQWNAWLSTNGGSEGGNEFFVTPYVSPNKTLLQPATAHGAIAVASYVTRSCWKPDDSESCDEPIVAIGDISPFSGRGPTRDGRPKPEIAAPGQFIIGALSQDVTAPFAAERITSDGLAIAQQGTSMAAPFVTGTVALLFQMEPTLQPDDIIAVLGATARQDSFTGATWNAQWGMGKLDALAAVNELYAGILEAEAGPQTPLQDAPPLVTPLPCSPGEYYAEYFNTHTLSATQVITRCESSIDYDWRTGNEPFAGLGVDNFSVRWQADFALSAGDYAVRASANDGVRVFVNDELVLDGWRDVMSEASYESVFTIAKSGMHRVRVEYYERVGRASVSVQWQRQEESSTDWLYVLSTPSDGGTFWSYLPLVLN